ncbi:MAG: aminodeoxychorismate lyase [Gammaproteobacteria bacterium]
MILINGVLEHCISADDRGFQYGDGLFETIEVDNGRCIFLERHLKRLRRGCHRLTIPFPEKKLLESEIGYLIRDNQKAVIKIIVTRGSGGRGYRRPEPTAPTRMIRLYPYPVYPEHFFESGIAARFCTTCLGRNPSLAGIKHLNRLEQILARSEWNSDDYQEGIMTDSDDNVIEGTMTNLFMVKKGALLTPRLNRCGVSGIAREIVIQLAKKYGLPVFRATLKPVEIFAADELFLTNSIIGLWPVRRLDHIPFTPGKITRFLMDRYCEYKLKDSGYGG